MSINDLFYTDKATLMIAIPNGKPNEWGVIDSTYEIIAENVPCSITPISTYHSQQKYGITSDITFEVALDTVENCELATHIVVNDVPYKIKTYTVYPQFMCLSKSITYGLVK